jgi:putative transposase
MSPRMHERSTAQHGRRFPAVIIRHAVWLYLRFPLSFRDVKELLAERGIEVSYESIRRWVTRFGPRLAEALRRREAKPGRVWHLDEMTVRIGRTRYWHWRAVDEHGATLEVLLQERRDTEAAERFFRTLLSHTGGEPPERITTDKLGSYAAAKRRLHMGRFRCPTSAQRFLSAFVRVGNLFRPRRHLLTAAEYRSTMRDRFATWREATALVAA